MTKKQSQPMFCSMEIYSSLGLSVFTHALRLLFTLYNMQVSLTKFLLFLVYFLLIDRLGIWWSKTIALKVYSCGFVRLCCHAAQG